MLIFPEPTVLQPSITFLNEKHHCMQLKVNVWTKQEKSQPGPALAAVFQQQVVYCMLIRKCGSS